jgi:hypothetical protein
VFSKSEFFAKKSSLAHREVSQICSERTVNNTLAAHGKGAKVSVSNLLNSELPCGCSLEVTPETADRQILCVLSPQSSARQLLCRVHVERLLESNFYLKSSKRPSKQSFMKLYLVQKDF